jgi:hypothetical protein
MIEIARSREPLLLVIAIGLMAVCVIWVRTLTVKETYQFVKKEKELRLSEYELQNQRLKLMRMTSPAKLQNRAKELDFVVPRAHQIIHWKNLSTPKGKS